MYFPARVWTGFWHDLLSCLTKSAHKGGEQWLRPAGVTQTMQAVCTDGHFDTKKAQETKTLGGPDSTMRPRREAALVRPDWVHPRRRISGRPPDVIQGRGHAITQPCTLLLRPASFQMHWNVSNAHSDVFNYKHMHHNRKLPFKWAPLKSSPHVGAMCK